jgi:hypothetical protein
MKLATEEAQAHQLEQTAQRAVNSELVQHSHLKRLRDELTVAASSSSTSVAEVLARMQDINTLRAEKASFAGMVKGLKAENDALQLRCDGQVQVHTNFLAEAELRSSEQQSKIGEQQTKIDAQVRNYNYMISRWAMRVAHVLLSSISMLVSSRTRSPL